MYNSTNEECLYCDKEYNVSEDNGVVVLSVEGFAEYYICNKCMLNKEAEQEAYDAAKEDYYEDRYNYDN